MHQRVVMRDAYGDEQHGILRPGLSDDPPTVTVNGTCWYTTTWERQGWAIASRSEWEL